MRTGVRGAMDLDSHEMVPTHMWPELFGPAGAVLGPLVEHRPTLNTVARPDIVGDAAPITPSSVWEMKGPGAPSAIDLGRRPAVMDVMGVERQLVFPTFALLGMMLAFNPDAHVNFGYDPAGIDRLAIAREVVAAHNAWAGRLTTEVDARRMRVVGVALGETVDSLMAETRDALAHGIRAMWIPSGVPPAGLSPGDERLDAFWAMCAAADVPVVLHIGTEFALLRTNAWATGVPAFTPSQNSSAEFPVEPYRGATLHMTQVNFLTAMILGGVFERHPTLRFGVIECAAHWVGPLAEGLDLWAKEFASRFAGVLTMRPSEYLARNVRVTPFVFEPVDDFLRRHPDLSTVYCYSSDYPHREGGAYSVQTFSDRLADFDDVTRQRFFTENGRWLLPD